MNIRIIFSLALCFFIGSAIQAQTTVSNDSTKKNIQHNLFLFNHYPRFSLESFSPASAGIRKFYSQKYLIKPDYRDNSLFRLDNSPFNNAVNYSSLNRSDFFYQYDPANPYGARDPLEGIINGSIDYLFLKLFDNK